jgi:hypothetical protein
MTLRRADLGDLESTAGFALGDRPWSELKESESAEGAAVRLWLRALDEAFRAEVGTQTPPVWIAHRFKWGPHAWPVRWADIPIMPYVDCGAMAALSTAVMQWRGTTALPTQLVLRFTRESVSGWLALWQACGLAVHWCDGIFAYHEATGVLDASGELRIWDPLGRFWLPVRPRPGYEGIVALRLCSDAPAHRLAVVAGRRIRSGIWYVVAGAFDDFAACPALSSRRSAGD